ncbi:MAG: transcriptional regulator [Ruminococcaceae bacterium]|nr:transcriptional regulator [Oscillospiraceae bacterium]
MTAPALWLGGGVALLGLLLLLRRPLGHLLRLGGRSLLSLAALTALGQIAPLAAILPGANLVNALVMGVLGLPGFGLLLMMQWVLT